MDNIFSSIRSSWAKITKVKKVVLIASALVLMLVASGAVYLAVRPGQPAGFAAVTPSPTPAPALASTPLIRPTPIPRPDAPKGFTAQYTGHSIILNWETGADGVTYTMWRSGELLTLEQTESFFVDEEYNQDNTYAIMACQDGNVSESVPLRVHVEPPAPAALAASFDIEAKAVRLAWNYTGKGGTFTVTAIPGGQSEKAYTIEEISGTSYVDAQADYDTAYTYSVTATDPRGIVSKPADIGIRTDPKPIPEYTLEMRVRESAVPGVKGTVDPVGSHVYQEGTVVGISAHPGEGCRFDHWELTGTGVIADPQSAETTVTMTGDCSVAAVFGHWYYTVHVDVFPWGAGNVSSADMSSSYIYGEEVDLRAEPADGYEFSYWSGAPSASYDRRLHFIMPDHDVWITANFREGYDFDTGIDFDYNDDYNYGWQPTW